MRKRRITCIRDGFFLVETLGNYNALLKEEYLEHAQLDDRTRKLLEAYQCITEHSLEGYRIEL